RKREEKLEWMYQGPGGMASRDEYLLGRPVDKFILDKVCDRDEADAGLLPGSIFARAGASSVLDMATKIREDPLFAIRCGRLQNSLEKKERKRKKEKKKKHKKHRRRSSSSSGSEEERPRIKSQKKVDNSSWKDAPSKTPGYGLQVYLERELRNPKFGFLGAAQGSFEAQNVLRAPETFRNGINWIFGCCSELFWRCRHSSREEKGRARSPSPKKSSRRQHGPGYTRKLSAEELERRRQEMMENAKWREEERANNLRKHRREEELERELQKLDARDGKFFHRLKLESASTSSLEDRVKRNIHSLQRTPAALEKNFMQR
ncbi:CWC25 factor, partial [Regulus satrapa]|nr:CWC25 factor [Regulus satrapa]